MTRPDTRQLILAELRRRERSGLPSPTMRELHDRLGISTSTAWRLLGVLEMEGMVRLGGTTGKARQIRLTEKGRGMPSDADLLKACYEALPGGRLRELVGERLGKH